jgi:hypothetical protein
MKYIAKPRLSNNIGRKEFDNAKDAVLYLNEMLSDVNVDPKFDYVYIAPSVSPKNLKFAIEDYVNIGKLIVEA